MIALNNFTEPEDVAMTEMQYCRFFTMYHFWPGTYSENEFFRCGKVKSKGNPYAWAQEKQCAEHICRKIGNGIMNIDVIRDDGTVWTIDLDAFETVTPLKVFMQDRRVV